MTRSDGATRNRLWAKVEKIMEDLEVLEPELDEDHFTSSLAWITNLAHDRAGDERDPWVDARRRILRGDLRLTWAHLSPGRGRIERRHGRYKIFLALGLTWTEMREVLMHELVHMETNLLFPIGTPAPTVRLGEAVVERITAERLAALA